MQQMSSTEVVNSTVTTETTPATIYVVYKKTDSNNTKKIC